jgi:hypothetical protein
VAAITKAKGERRSGSTSWNGCCISSTQSTTV